MLYREQELLAGNILQPDLGVQFNPRACTQGTAEDLGHGQRLEFLCEVGYLKLSSSRRNLVPVAVVCVSNGAGMSQACLRV